MQTLGKGPSFGFGDRTGLATPGHVAAMQRAGDGILPLFAQQSIREMSRTGRTPPQVMAEAVAGMEAAGWSGPCGADADHLKTAADIASCAVAGFRTYTLDPSDRLDDSALDADADTLRAKVEALGDSVSWLGHTIGRRVELDNGTAFELDEIACHRVAARYGRALELVFDLADAVQAAHAELGTDYDIELSVDESDAPTSLAEHWILAELCTQSGMPLGSVAPRFPGAFEKGIDHQGDAAELRQSLEDHAAISRALGGYKLSLHSGSDKLSVYAPLARATRGACHVKTAGTSWLEGLRAVARVDVKLFRRVIAFSRGRYASERKTYALSAELGHVPAPDLVDDARELENLYLGDWDRVPEGRGFTDPGRQIVHCTYGAVWNDPDLGPAVRGALTANADLHHTLLADHFERHLRALRAGLD